MRQVCLISCCCAPPRSLCFAITTVQAAVTCINSFNHSSKPTQHTCLHSAIGDEDWGLIVSNHLRALDKRASNAAAAFKLYTESGWSGWARLAGGGREEVTTKQLPAADTTDCMLSCSSLCGVWWWWLVVVVVLSLCGAAATNQGAPSRQLCRPSWPPRSCCGWRRCWSS